MRSGVGYLLGKSRQHELESSCSNIYSLVHGNIRCNARRCDQDEQQFVTHADGTIHRENCAWYETCSRKNRRVDHQELAVDAWIQRIIGDRIEEQFASWLEQQRTASNGNSSELGFYRQGNQDKVYLVFRSNGTHCHVQNLDQMNVFGGFGRVQSLSSPQFTGEFTGGCGWPNGFYRLGNQDAVYRLYGNRVPNFNIGDSYCHVANRTQMEAYGGFGQVRSIRTDSELFRGRTSTGNCPNP